MTDLFPIISWRAQDWKLLPMRSIRWSWSPDRNLNHTHTALASQLSCSAAKQLFNCKLCLRLTIAKRNDRTGGHKAYAAGSGSGNVWDLQNLIIDTASDSVSLRSSHEACCFNNLDIGRYSLVGIMLVRRQVTAQRAAHCVIGGGCKPLIHALGMVTVTAVQHPYLPCARSHACLANDANRWVWFCVGCDSNNCSCIRTCTWGRIRSCTWGRGRSCTWGRGRCLAHCRCFWNRWQKSCSWNRRWGRQCRCCWDRHCWLRSSSSYWDTAGWNCYSCFGNRSRRCNNSSSGNWRQLGRHAICKRIANVSGHWGRQRPLRTTPEKVIIPTLFHCQFMHISIWNIQGQAGKQMIRKIRTRSSNAIMGALEADVQVLVARNSWSWCIAWLTIPTWKG